MKNKKKKVWIGISAIVAVVAIILVFGLSINHVEKTSTASSKHITKPVKKTAIKESNNQKAVENADVKKENAKKPEVQKTQAATTNVKKPEDNKVEAKKEAPASASTVLSKPVTKYVNISSLNVRNGAGTNYSVVTPVTQGQVVTVTETSSNGWSKVNVNNITGWVSDKYLSTTKPAVQKPVTQTTTPSTPPTTTTTSKLVSSGNVADQLKTVSANHQLILVTTSNNSTSVATIRTFEKNSSGKWNPVLTISGHVGKYGLTSNMREGGKKSPIGKYTIGTAFGRFGNPGTKLPYRKITTDDVWVDDPASTLYNTWQSRSKTQGQWKSAENMNIAAYNYGFVINYNTARIPDKGSAIFFHVGAGYTLGCTDTAQSNVVSILKWLDPAKNPVIIQTPVSGLGNF